MTTVRKRPATGERAIEQPRRAPPTGHSLRCHTEGDKRRHRGLLQYLVGRVAFLSALRFPS